jgi:hypothetical protein
VILDRVGSTHSSRAIDPYPTITLPQPCGAASWISYRYKRRTRTPQSRTPMRRPTATGAAPRPRLPSPPRAAENPASEASRRQSVPRYYLTNDQYQEALCAGGRSAPVVSSPRCGMLPAGHSLPVNGHCGRANEPPRKQQKPQTAAIEQPLPQRAAHSGQALGHRRSRLRRAPGPLRRPP